jgi:hypothetical protein
MSNEKWQDIYRDLGPEEPLNPDDQRLHRGLFGDLIDNIARRLSIERNKNQKILFSGNGGCGKSTFVKLLEEHRTIKGQFFPVRYTIKDVLDANDITHIDLLLSLTLQTFIKVTEKEITIDKDLLKSVQELALSLAGLIKKEEIRETKKKIGIKTKAGLGIPALLSKWLQTQFFACYERERETRERVRRYYKPNITDFLNTINTILDQIQCLLKDKSLLVLIDDTDKIPPERAMEIFDDNGTHLAAPHANILFVVSTYISCSSRYPIMVKKIGEEEFFPAIKIVEKDGSLSNTTDKNYNLLKELVFKRIPKDFIEDSALKKAIEMSGGVVSELIRILREAVFYAKGIIREEHVNTATIKISNQYTLIGYVPLLKKILDNPDYMDTISDEEEALKTEARIRELLYLSALFQYRNDEKKWYRPYPIFIEWLKKLS